MAAGERPDPRVVAVFGAMVRAVDGVERKGDTIPYVSINGNMYASVSRAGRIGLRLSKDDLAAFEEAFGPSPFEPLPGFVQRGYAAVPERLYDDPEALQSWFRRSHTFAAGLRPKPTRRG